MNERIQELLAQAYKEASVPGPIEDKVTVQEKFAELIVKECCGAADEWYQKHNELHWDPAQHIRNHFGVEE